jgi:adenosylcobinamide amidohydrolase
MGAILRAELHDRDGWPVLWWAPTTPVLTVSSSVVGGGLGVRHWVCNASVADDWDGVDELGVVAAAAAGRAAARDGCGLLTAADVRHAAWAEADGAECLGTVGLGWPTWAAVPHGHDDAPPPRRADTVNLLVWVPVPLSQAALVNAACTVTEAKTQALVELGVPGTGTATDAVVVCCPVPGAGRPDPEPYGGPRSRWGARLARAVHAAVRHGALDDHRRATAAGYHRAWTP